VLGQLAQPILTSGDDHLRDPGVAENPHDCFADAARRTGDER
jgi:hypothetical protein